MKKVLYISLFLLFVGLIFASRYLIEGAAIATGYTAKQICSGVLVSGLPQEFIWEKDIEPSLAALGPAIALLDVEVDVEGDSAQQQVKATFLHDTAIATYQQGYGCTLNKTGNEFPNLVKVEIASSLEQGIQPEKMQSVIDAAFAEPEGDDYGKRNTLAIAVMHKGKLIAERYRAPVTADTSLQGWSMNKSLMATWVGMLVKREQLALETPVLEFLQQTAPQQVSDLGLDKTLDPKLTVKNLLHMESGFDFTETYSPGDDVTAMLYKRPAMWQVAPEQGHSSAPGKVFNYSSGDTNLASYIWQMSLGGDAKANYAQWVASQFSQPLGINSLVAEADASGIQVGSSYTYMTTRDWLRVGQMWLDGWYDRQPLLPEKWIQDSVQPLPSDPSGRYGRSFWLNTQGNPFPDLPRNLFYASGHNAQAVVILPEQELVVVRLGLTVSGADDGLDDLLLGVLESLSNTRDE